MAKRGRPCKQQESTSIEPQQTTDPDQEAYSAWGEWNKVPNEAVMAEAENFVTNSSPESRTLAAYFADVRHRPFQAREEQLECGRRVRNFGDIAARNALVEGALRFAAHLSKRQLRSGISLTYNDLIQAGNIGLITAAEKFDPERGFSFLTYAGWWVRQSVLREVADHGRVVRLPVHQEEALFKIRQMQKKLEASLDRNPSHEEVAVMLEMSVGHLRQMLLWGETTASLNAPAAERLGEVNETTIGDLVEDYTTMPPDVLVEAKEVFEGDCCQLRYFLGKLSLLPERLQEIIRLRYGLGENEEVWTLEEVGEKWGVSRERIRQLQADAWFKLEALGVRLNDTSLEVLLARIARLENFIGIRADQKTLGTMSADQVQNLVATASDTPIEIMSAPEAPHKATTNPSDPVGQLSEEDREDCEAELRRLESRLRTLRGALDHFPDEDRAVFRAYYGLSVGEEQIRADLTTHAKLTSYKAKQAHDRVWARLEAADVISKEWLPGAIERVKKLRRMLATT